MLCGPGGAAVLSEQGCFLLSLGQEGGGDLESHLQLKYSRVDLGL